MSELKPCPECKGSGWKENEYSGHKEAYPCKKCKGIGKIAITNRPWESSDSKNNHYFIGGQLYIIPKIIANLVDSREDEQQRQINQLRAENEKLREALRDIKLFIEGKYYNVALRIIEKALNEVKE